MIAASGMVKRSVLQKWLPVAIMAHMKHFSIKEAKDQLPALVRAVESGEKVTITRNGKPVVDVIIHQRKGGIDFEGLRRWKEERGYTIMAGPVSDDFDDPLPWDFLFTQSL